MNRKRRTAQMRRFINKYGVITNEYKRPPDKFYPPYRKGSYFATFDSEKLDICCAVGDIDKYNVYKELVKTIMEHNNKYNKGE